MLNKILSIGAMAAIATLAIPPANVAAAVKQAAPSKEARDHFAQGATFYEEGDLQSAAFEFRRAYELSHDYRILYNLAIVDLDLHNYAAAKRSFELYLAEGGRKVPADRRASVEGELKSLNARVGTIAVQVNVEGASITLDGKPAGTAPLSEELLVNLGEHRVEVRHRGYLTAERTIQVEGGKQTLVIADLQPIARSETRPTQAANGNLSRADTKRLDALKVATWTSLAITGAAGVAAIVTGSLALRTDQQLEEERSMVPADLQRLSDLQSQTEGFALSTDILVGVTAAAAAVTIGVGIAAILESRSQPSAQSGKRATRTRRVVTRVHGTGLTARF